jgi:hypothetical protein
VRALIAAVILLLLLMLMSQEKSQACSAGIDSVTAERVRQEIALDARHPASDWQRAQAVSFCADWRGKNPDAFFGRHRIFTFGSSAGIVNFLSLKTRTRMGVAISFGIATSWKYFSSPTLCGRDIIASLRSVQTGCGSTSIFFLKDGVILAAG